MRVCVHLSCRLAAACSTVEIQFRGMYRGLAWVVKLPKAVSLTGAAWREWLCHLSLPPHRNLVRFLGALPMSAISYPVLSFIRQGSLYSPLASSTASSAYTAGRMA